MKVHTEPAFEAGADGLRVFLDARLAARGLGIASATERLSSALRMHRGIAVLRVNSTGRGWTRVGKIETLARSGLLDVAPRLDPRCQHTDVVHYFGNTSPRRPDKRTIITVHDVMMASRRSIKNRTLARFLLPGIACGRAGAVIAISTQTADDLVRLLPDLSGHVMVVPHGYRVGLFNPAERTHILMFGGSSDPRKRVPLGLASYSRYAETRGAASLPLVVAARAGINTEELTRYIRHGRVVVEADPDNLRVEQLLAGAACLIYPTTEEGFGLPILEAGEFGTPVVFDTLARIPREPLGSHAFGVDGASVDDWANQIARITCIGPIPDALAGLPTWSQVAQAYVDLYREVAR